MNLYQFIASLVQSVTSLAWPAAVVFSVWIFRRELASLLPRMRLRYKDFDVNFRLDEAEKIAKALPPPATDPAPMTETKEEKDKFEKIADLSPRAAMLELRNELQGMVADFGLYKGVIFKPPRNTLGYMVRVLRNQAMIDAETTKILDDLRAIGNTAAHDDRAEITRDEAMRYKALVEVVRGRLRAIQAGDIVPTASSEVLFPNR